ncbi:MAG: hypothetical protein WD048_11010 [Chitinophagales bacterium]
MTKILAGLLMLFILAGTMAACKSSKEAETQTRELTREEKLKTMEVSVQTKKMELNKVKLNEFSLNKFREELYGKWNWHKTICCARTPQTTLAKDSEQSKSIYFSEDSTATKYENGKQVYQEEYEVGNALNDHRITVRIGGYRTAIAHLKNDTLVMDYGYMDLEISYYIRAGE